MPGSALAEPYIGHAHRAKIARPYLRGNLQSTFGRPSNSSPRCIDRVTLAWQGAADKSAEPLRGFGKRLVPAGNHDECHKLYESISTMGFRESSIRRMSAFTSACALCGLLLLAASAPAFAQYPGAPLVPDARPRRRSHSTRRRSVAGVLPHRRLLPYRISSGHDYREHRGRFLYLIMATRCVAASASAAPAPCTLTTRVQACVEAWNLLET